MARAVEELGGSRRNNNGTCYHLYYFECIYLLLFNLKVFSQVTFVPVSV